ncbi:MAG: hypothetical protein ACOYLV_13710 [Rubrivivax sp.]
MGSSVSSISYPSAASAASTATGTSTPRSTVIPPGSIAVEITSVSLGAVSENMVRAYPPFAVFRSMGVRDRSGSVASTLRWPIDEEAAPAARYNVASSLGVSGHAGTDRANLDSSALQPLVERASRPLPQVQGSRSSLYRQG